MIPAVAEVHEFATDELRHAMREGYAAIISFVTSEPFKNLCYEFGGLTDLERDAYVRNVILDRDELLKRGVAVPEGILLQRSSFGDRRPTLFCVKKYLPKRFHGAWENVNLTFDAQYPDDAVSRDAEVSWRKPVRPDIQSLLLAAGLPLECIPEKFQVT